MKNNKNPVGQAPGPPASTFVKHEIRKVTNH